MKKLFVIVTLFCVLFSCSSNKTSFRDEMLSFNNLYINKNIDKLVENNEVIVKTDIYLAPKLVGNIIYIADDTDFETKVGALLRTMYANTNANTYIFDKYENQNRYIKEFIKRKIDYKNVYFLGSKNEITFLLNSFDKIFGLQNKSGYTKLDLKRIALISNAKNIKSLYYISNEILKDKKQHFDIDQFGYIGSVSRYEVDTNNRLNAKVMLLNLEKYLEAK